MGCFQDWLGDGSTLFHFVKCSSSNLNLQLCCFYPCTLKSRVQNGMFRWWNTGQTSVEWCNMILNIVQVQNGKAHGLRWGRKDWINSFSIFCLTSSAEETNPVMSPVAQSWTSHISVPAAESRDRTYSTLTLLSVNESWSELCRTTGMQAFTAL